MPLTAAKGAKKRADDLFSKLIRSRGSCQACGTTSTLQCAHIRSRHYNNTRTDLENALCLCAGCHFYYTGNPLLFAQFIKARLGVDVYDSLVRKSQENKKMNWAAEVERLRPLLAAVEAR